MDKATFQQFAIRT